LVDHSGLQDCTLSLLAFRDMLDARVDYLGGCHSHVLTSVRKRYENFHVEFSNAKEFVKGYDWKLLAELLQNKHGCILLHVSVIFNFEPLDGLVKGFFDVFGCNISTGLRKVSQAFGAFFYQLHIVVAIF